MTALMTIGKENVPYAQQPMRQQASDGAIAGGTMRHRAQFALNVRPDRRRK